MSGKSPAFASQLLSLLFNATTIAGLAENASASPDASLYFALHTADPTASGTQNTSEISYTGYARVGVARTAAGFTVTGASVSPAATVVFPASTGGTGGTATFFSIGTAGSGAGEVIYAGPISPTISVSTGVTPELTSATAITEA